MNLTDKIKLKIMSGQLTISEIARLLDITRPTVYSRLKNNNWKKLEVVELNKWYGQDFFICRSVKYFIKGLKMADPAVLLYTGDFLNGVIDLTMEERGQYITLLCLQHQKGHLSDKTIRLSLGSVSVDVMSKFSKDESGLFFNKRMDEEIEKRKKFTESRKINGLKGGRPKDIKPIGLPLGLASANLIENDNDNVNKDIVDNKTTSDFEIFWNKYDKKIDRKKSESKWNKLKLEQKKKAIDYLDVYIKNTPDKQYRKNPATYLFNESWENETIGENNGKSDRQEVSNITSEFFDAANQ